MKKFDLGQTISVLANIGVIAGIVFLAFELQQNNRLLAADAEYNALQRRSANSVANNPEQAEFWFKVNSGAPLTELEQFRVDATARNNLVDWEWTYGQVQAGNLALSRLPIEVYRAAFRGQGGERKIDHAPIWTQIEAQLDPSFVAFMNEYVIEAGPPN